MAPSTERDPDLPSVGKTSTKENEFVQHNRTLSSRLLIAMDSSGLWLPSQDSSCGKVGSDMGDLLEGFVRRRWALHIDSALRRQFIRISSRSPAASRANVPCRVTGCGSFAAILHTYRVRPDRPGVHATFLRTATPMSYLCRTMNDISGSAWHAHRTPWPPAAQGQGLEQLP